MNLVIRSLIIESFDYSVINDPMTAQRNDTMTNELKE